MGGEGDNPISGNGNGVLHTDVRRRSNNQISKPFVIKMITEKWLRQQWSAKDYPQPYSAAQGLTLIELMVIMAILAIIAAGALTYLTNEIGDTKHNTALINTKAAINQLYLSALTGGGATLFKSSDTGVTALSISTIEGHIVHQQYSLPAGATIKLNGETITCISLNNKGFPVITSICPHVPDNLIPPFQWSVEDADGNTTFE